MSGISAGARGKELVFFIHTRGRGVWLQGMLAFLNKRKGPLGRGPLAGLKDPNLATPLSLVRKITPSRESFAPVGLEQLELALYTQRWHHGLQKSFTLEGALALALGACVGSECLRAGQSFSKGPTKFSPPESFGFSYAAESYMAGFSSCGGSFS